MSGTITLTKSSRPRNPKGLTRRPIAEPQKLKLRNVDILIIEERCKGCKFCIEFCPKDVLEEDKKYNARGVRTPRVTDAQMLAMISAVEH